VSNLSDAQGCPRKKPMYFVALGVLLLALKLLDSGPVALWPWWVVLAPFAFAAAWWAWADANGYTKRRAMERMEAKKAERRRRNMEALGTGPKRKELNGLRPGRPAWLLVSRPSLSRPKVGL